MRGTNQESQAKDVSEGGARGDTKGNERRRNDWRGEMTERRRADGGDARGSGGGYMRREVRSRLDQVRVRRINRV